MFGGLRIGLYEPVKKLIVGKDHVGDVGLGQKIVAGLFTGAPGAAASCACAWHCAACSRSSFSRWR
jgi:solute carrier family 25 uncoupling protein 8/9